MPHPEQDRGVLLESQLPIAESYTSAYLEFFRMLPLQLSGGRLQIAADSQPDPDALADFEAVFGAPADLVMVPPADLNDAIRRTFASAESVVETVRDLTMAGDARIGDSDSNFADIRDLANQPPVIRFVNLLVREAVAADASDIHLESTRDTLRIRLRIDGVLAELASPPANIQAAVISRIKLLGELDIAERRVPQDGRVRARLEGRDLDLRVSTVPTMFGESVVLRLLDHGGRPAALEQLGMAPATFERFVRAAQRPHGMLLATGPTGSGKTTTLYAALGLRNPSEEKIVTVEDPIEYHLPAITQVPVNTRAGMTFARALRSILRQDPDVLMVGEMRDSETAAIGVQSAMTGHLVYSTLHTNDAVSALARLRDLGVEDYMVAATVEAVLAQRLVRRTCSECRVTYAPEASALAWLAERPMVERSFERGAGCVACRGTGYRGRLGLFELLVISERVKDALVRDQPPARLKDIAREEGMSSLRQDGWEKVLAGLTTVEEVLRVVQD